jgi:integrase
MNFRTWLVNRGKSPHTAEEYDYSVSRYLAFCHDKPSRGTLVKYIEHLIDSKAAPASISRHYHALRAYFRFLGQPDAADDIVIPPVRSKEARYIPRADLDKLMAVSRIPMDRAMVRLLYDAALRAGEILKVTPADLSASKGFVRIVGGKDRGPNEADYVPIGDVALNDVLRYVKTANIPANGRIFPMTYSSLRCRLQRLCRIAGISQYNLHSLRHGRATELIVDQGTDLADASKFMRHKSIQTTMRYTHIAPQTLKKRIKPAFEGT